MPRCPRSSPPVKNSILVGSCLEKLSDLGDKSVDLIFADPPYNLQLPGTLHRPNQTKVHGVEEAWDHFEDFAHYDAFTRAWLTQCRRVMTDTATIWVIGSYHNIFRLGTILQDLGFWILNDIVWLKTNPMPNFRGCRFTNAHETLIWASKGPKQKYTFNYEAMKVFNDDVQMRSDWTLPICTGKERLKGDDGIKKHPTQKPQSLLYRVLLASSNKGDLVLDPFFGTGTTGAVAKKLGRHFIGIEQNEDYARAALERIEKISPLDDHTLSISNRAKNEPKIPFGNLLERGLIHPGEILYDPLARHRAHVRADGSLDCQDGTGSIHKLGARLQGLSACNGWTFWHIRRNSQLLPIDSLRQQLRAELAQTPSPSPPVERPYAKAPQTGIPPSSQQRGQVPRSTGSNTAFEREIFKA